jgi:signal peptidase II
LGLAGEEWLEPGKQSLDAVYGVRDWILWQVNDQWRWPNFNLADSLLVCGAAILFLHAIRQPSCPAEESDDSHRTVRIPSDAAAS